MKASKKETRQQVTSSERRLLRLRVEEATDLDYLEKEVTLSRCHSVIVTSCVCLATENEDYT